LICVGKQRRILNTGNADLLRTGKRTSKERNKEGRRLREGVAEKDGKKVWGTEYVGQVGERRGRGGVGLAIA
jgi:hypothetical protein